MSRLPPPQQQDVGLPAGQASLDPAQQSLAEALRLSFRILKLVMLIVVALFAVSGFFTVKQNQAALVLRFGRPVGGVESPRLYEPGLHWALPYPIDRKIVVPLSKEAAQVESFFFHVPEADRHKSLDELRPRFGGLRPGVDGMLLTADLNVIHAKWFVEYRIEDPVAYVRNVYVPPGLDDAEQGRLRRDLVSRAVENACVRVVASFRADDILFGTRIDQVQSLIKQQAQRTLDRLGCGIAIDQLLVREPTPPLQVRQAFLDVLQADQEKQKTIEEAIKQANTILNAAAGVAYELLLVAIEQYERAYEAGQQARADRLRQQISQLLLRQAGGEAARLILEARTYYTETVQSIEATAQKFRRLLPQYRRNPAILLRQLWADTKRELLSGDVEKLYLPEGAKEIRVQLGHNPELFRQRELKRYRRQVEQGQ